MNRKFRIVLSLTLLLCMMLLGACGSGSAGGGETIYIGLTVPITGQLATFGEHANNSAKLACDQINAAGGIGGKKVEFVLLDDKMDPTEAALVAQRFIERKDITAVVGSITSGTTLAVLPIYEEAGMPVVCPTGNNPSLAGYSNFIRIVMDANLEAPMVGAMIMNNLGGKRIGAIYDNSDYGTTMLEASSGIIKDLGGELVATEAFLAGADKDFSVQLAKMLKEQVDTIILVADYNEGSLIIAQAETMGGFEDVKWCGDSYLLGDILLERIGASPLAQNVYMACDYNPFSDNPNHQSFVAAYGEAYNGLIPSEPAGFTYDAFNLIFTALDAGATKENLIETIKSMEFTNLICAEQVEFDETGNRVGAGNDILTIRDGKFEPLGETVNTTGIY